MEYSDTSKEEIMPFFPIIMVNVEWVMLRNIQKKEVSRHQIISLIYENEIREKTKVQ